MNLNELYSLYNYLNRTIENFYIDNMTNNTDIDPYLENENMVLDLYHQILHGKATRKDFLISSIKDMVYYIDKNQIKGVYSTLLFRFRNKYLKHHTKGE